MMLHQKSIVTLLGPADPARSAPVPPRRHTARELIQRAEAVPETLPDSLPEASTPITGGYRRPTWRRAHPDAGSRW